MFIARRATCLLLLVPLLYLTSCASDPAEPPHENGRTVPGIGSVAIDTDGNLYVASQSSVTKWDADGHALPFSVPACDVVVADGDYLYCATKTQVRRFKLASGQPAPFAGPAAHISIDAVCALDVAGATLYVGAGNKMRMFDSSSGAATGEFDVHLPQAVAVDPLGQIWVAHDHSVIQAFRADGYSGVTYGGLGEVTSLSFGPGAKLYAGDAATGQVFVLDTGGSPAQFVPVLKVSNLRAVAADGRGNLVTLEGGGRVAKWSSDGKLLWERTPLNGGGRGP
ncbi:MAG: Flagellar hook capping protein [Phycisphaerales bacterium]|nr:Flagellar hook capping protein [Phycisphaerales bacterium]